MPKLTLSTPNGQTTIQLIPNELINANHGVLNVNGAAVVGMQIHNQQILNFNGAAVIGMQVRNATEIGVENNHHLTVTECSNHLDVINVTSGIIDLHNSFVANGQYTNVVVGNNSALNITGEDISIGSLTVNLNSTLSFTHNGHNYILQTPNEIGVIGSNGGVTVQNMDKLVTICEFINNKWVTDSDFALDEICYLRAYQKLDLNFVSLFMEQNKMVSADSVNYFITQNYFELADITHDANLTGSTIEGAGPYNITEEICSWLKLDDVKLFGDTEFKDEV